MDGNQQIRSQAGKGNRLMLTPFVLPFIVSCLNEADYENPDITAQAINRDLEQQGFSERIVVDSNRAYKVVRSS